MLHVNTSMSVEHGRRNSAHQPGADRKSPRTSSTSPMSRTFRPKERVAPQTHAVSSFCIMSISSTSKERGQIYRGAVTREIGAKENKRTVRQFFEVTKVISKGGAFLLTPEVRVCVLWTSPDLSPHLSPDSLSARSTHPSSELARTRKADPRIQTLAGGQPFRPRSTVTTKSCTLVSMVRAEREPRLPSLVVTNSDISTQ